MFWGEPYNGMVSTATKVTTLCIVLAVVLWYTTTKTTDNTLIQLAVLIVVGVVLPTTVNEWRDR